MPQIQIVSPEGNPFTLTSSEPEVVANWLLEIIRKMVTTDSRYGPWRIGPIFPLFVWSEKEQRLVPDWPNADTSHHYDINQKRLGVLAKFLTEFLSD